MTLRINELSAGYGNEEVVRRISKSISPSSITTIIGPNGCGKTTLLRCIARLHPVAAGSVVLEGRNIQTYRAAEYARALGILPQGAKLPLHISVRDLVRRGRYPHLGLFQTERRHDVLAVDQALVLTDLEDLAHRPVDELSGGQRQRAWIAMALAQDSEVLLLDEPTTYLDISYRHEVLALISSLSKERGKTVVTVLHDLHEAASLSDEIIAVKNGEIYAAGTVKEVFSEDTVSKLYDIACRWVNNQDPESVAVILPVDDELELEVQAESALDAVKAGGTHRSAAIFESVELGYDCSTVLSHINLEITRGKITAILGSNGSGKSTLLKALCGQLRPRSGQLSLLGDEIENQNNFVLSSCRALVPQEELFFNLMSVEEYVNVGRYRYGSWLRQWTREDRESICRSLRIVGMEEFATRGMKELSGGQQQRVRFARVLVQESEILILDEPTSYLDLRGQKEVLHCVRDLNRIEGKTVIMVLHDPWQACLYSDEIVLLEGAGVVAAGKTKDVLTRELLERSYGVPWKDVGTHSPLLIPGITAG